MVGLGDPGHVKAHVGWRTHDGRIPARRIKLSVLCYSGTGTYTLIEEAEGSKREQTRREAGGTRNEIRQCSRAKPAEGRGMTEPCDMGQRYVGTSTSSLGALLWSVLGATASSQQTRGAELRVGTRGT